MMRAGMMQPHEVVRLHLNDYWEHLLKSGGQQLGPFYIEPKGDKVRVVQYGDRLAEIKDWPEHELKRGTSLSDMLMLCNCLGYDLPTIFLNYYPTLVFKENQNNI